jgi:Permeases
MKIALERFFSTELNNTTIQKEILAGITTFITMAYIIFVNPQMMAQSGMDHGAIFVGTCLAAAHSMFCYGSVCNLACWTCSQDGA